MCSASLAFCRLPVGWWCYSCYSVWNAPGPLACQERSVQSEFHLQRNQCDGALHPKRMLGEADSIRSLNQKLPLLSISIKAGINSWKKGLWRDSEGRERGKRLMREWWRARRSIIRWGYETCWLPGKQIWRCLARKTQDLGKMRQYKADKIWEYESNSYSCYSSLDAIFSQGCDHFLENRDRRLSDESKNKSPCADKCSKGGKSSTHSHSLLERQTVFVGQGRCFMCVGLCAIWNQFKPALSPVSRTRDEDSSWHIQQMRIGSDGADFTSREGESVIANHDLCLHLRSKRTLSSSMNRNLSIMTSWGQSYITNLIYSFAWDHGLQRRWLFNNPTCSVPLSCDDEESDSFMVPVGRKLRSNNESVRAIVRNAVTP